MTTPPGPVPPGGPGWYQAADGRWYPAPPQYGGPRQPPHGAPQPAHGAPPPAYDAPHGRPPRKSSAGRIIAIVLAVVVVLVALAGFAVFRFVSGVGERVGDLAGDAGLGCDAVSTEAVDAALGGRYEVIQLGGLGRIAAPVLDSRVLADAPTCWAVEAGDAETGGRLARIARYSGADAAERFAAEKTAAMGTTQDQGNGVSVSSSAYFDKDVPAGDEAFCTTGDPTASAGALVRRGDLLVYVSTNAASTNAASTNAASTNAASTNAAGDGASSIPDLDLGPGAGPSDAITFGTDDANCDRAVALAAAVR